MQIAIEEQHGANPLYTYANVTCQGATTADFDFQMDYLPKDCFAFGFVEPVTVEGSKGFLQVDKRSFVQCTKLQLAPNGGSSKKLNVYGLTMNFCCPSLPQSEPGGGAVSTVRVNIHYAIADVYFVYAGKEKSDQKAYTHEFKLEPGENITDVTVKSVEGVGAYSLVFKTTQGRTSETFEGDEMEYLDSDDLSRKNWAAGRGNMIAGLKTKARKCSGRRCHRWRGEHHGHHEEAREPERQDGGALRSLDLGLFEPSSGRCRQLRAGGGQHSGGPGSLGSLGFLMRRDDWKVRDEDDEEGEEEEEQPTQVQFCFDGAVVDESDTSALLKGEWRAANPNSDDPELQDVKIVTEGRWSAMRVVDESARLAGLWRVSVGLQDGAQAYAYTMWLTAPGLKMELLCFWWSLDANEISGTWSATRLDGAVLEKLIEPKVTKCTGGCRLTASGLKNKGKPIGSSKHILQSKKSTDDDDELECERCGREVNGAHWWCNRCDVAVCSRCEKQTVAKAEDEDERRQFEVAALDRFKLSGKVYFEVSCEKVGDGALIGLALQNADDDYSPGEDMGTFALMNNGVCRHNGKDDGKSAAWKDGVTISVAVDCEQGTVQVATVDKPQFEQVLQLAEEEMPKEVGLPLIALLSPGDKGNMMVNVGQQPFKLQPPAKAFRPLAELMELRKQWRVTLPDNVETWPVYVKPSRQAEGAESLQAQWGFEELGTQDESGVKWIRHSGGWSPVSLEALGRLCTGLTPLPSTIDALEKRGDANGFKFFRFVVSKARGGDTVNGVSLGQLLLRREGVEIDLAEATAENPDGQFSDTEGPQNAIDGRTSTRWHSTVLSPLVIKMPKPVLIDSFSFRTALNDEQLDPVEWRLEASNDQSTWKVLHSQERNESSEGRKETSYHPPRRRNGQASWFDTSTRGSGSSGKNKLVPWTSGVKIVAGHWHALTLAVDLPSSKMTIWVDGEVALEICDPSSPLLRCDGPLSLDPQDGAAERRRGSDGARTARTVDGIVFGRQEGLCLFGRKPFLKKEWSWMLGAQIKGLQLQTLAPDLFNTWALQMPLGVNSASLSSCWRCKSQRVRSAFRPPGDTDPRHPGIKIFTTDSFEEILEKDKKVFLCVSADWCGACQQMKPQWFALAKLLQSSSAVTIGVMNIDENDVDRRYFPEHHIPVVKLLIKTPVTEDSLETNDKPTVISYEGGHHIAGWLEFLGHHTDLNLQDVLDSNYDAYEPRPEEAKEVALQKKVSVEAKEPGEDELWIRLLLKRLNEEVEKALRGGHPRKPLDFLLKEVFLPGAKPDDLQDEFTEPRRVRTAELRGGPWSIDLNLHFPTIFPNHLDFKVDRPRSPLDSQMIRAGLHAEERQMAVARGDSGEEKKNAQQQWSAVEQQKASARAEPMALPMLQRSWAKIKQAIDTRAPKRMQTIQESRGTTAGFHGTPERIADRCREELLVRGLDLDFNALGREQASVLWLAAANNDLEVLQFCLAYGADPHRATDGVLPTEAAAATGALQALAMLLRIGAVPGRALHFAAATAQVGALRVLINSKADLQVRVNGLSPLGVAVSRDNDEIIKLLLQQPELASEPLGSVACEQLGLAANANLLYLAAQCGLDRTVDLLIQKGAEPSLAYRAQSSAMLCPCRDVSDVSSVRLQEDQEKLAAICSGVSAVRPTVLASLLDDAEAIRLLASVETSSDLVPAASPSALMWAQWAGASQAARVMLDAGVTLSNTDLEGLRRLGRARRQSQDGKEDLPSAAGRLLEPGAADAAGAGGRERTTLMRFLVQREIARGEGKSGLSPNYLLALYASSIYVDIHAQCHRFMLLLKAALNTLPSARGPCYRAILGSEEAPVSSLKHYSPGAVIRWPAGACGTLDFSAAMSALSCGAERSRGVIFKVRRLLTAKEVDETNKQVLFMGGAMRVVGLFPLNGPLMAAERELAAQSKALTQRLGQFCPSLDMVRRPETAQPWDVREQPLVMVLLDEEEES
eukprot:g3004.t1